MDDGIAATTSLDLASRVTSIAHHQIVPLAHEFAEYLAPGWRARRERALELQAADARPVASAAVLDGEPLAEIKPGSFHSVQGADGRVIPIFDDDPKASEPKAAPGT
jgi:hypothetical protein